MLLASQQFTEQTSNSHAPHKDMKTIRSSRLPFLAFTLIELLVVIAIIAILAGMLLPSLSKAKATTIGARCLNGQKQLSIGFTLYAGDFDEKLLPVGNGGGYWPGPIDSMGNVIPPPPNFTGLAPDVALANVQRGIQAGPLYRYVADVKVYNCPGDKRTTKTPGSGWGYDSYSKVDGMNGSGWGGSPLTAAPARLRVQCIRWCSSRRPIPAAITGALG